MSRERQFSPMLAGKAPSDLANLGYPVLVSRKLDGFRALVVNGVVVSRNLLPIPCPTVQELFGHKEYNGFDGELLVGDPTNPLTFNNSQSMLSSHAHLAPEAAEQLKFYVFDDFSSTPLPFGERLKGLEKRIRKAAKHLEIVAHERVINQHGVEMYEDLFVHEGYEGLMIRDPFGEYKFGRSTTKQGLLLKLKRFEDAEAKVIAVKELEHNQNQDRTGGVANRRSSKKSGKVGGDVLGAFKVVGVNGKFKGVEFEVGSGMTARQREEFWQGQHGLLLKLITYRFFPHGSKDKPRFPTFRGFRNEADL